MFFEAQNKALAYCKAKQVPLKFSNVDMRITGED